MHPGFAIAFDNIDGKRECRHMTKDNQNLDFHWVNHKIIMNRVSGGCLETSPRDITSLSNLKLFPTVDDQKFQRHNYTVLISRVLVEHLDCFSALKDVCVFHIPHKYSNEMAKKSDVSYSFSLWVLSCCFLLLYWFSKFSPLISAFMHHEWSNSILVTTITCDYLTVNVWPHRNIQLHLANPLKSLVVIEGFGTQD